MKSKNYNSMVRLYGGAYLQVCYNNLSFIINTDGYFVKTSTVQHYEELLQKNFKAQEIPLNLRLGVQRIAGIIKDCLDRGLDIKKYIATQAMIKKSSSQPEIKVTHVRRIIGSIMRPPKEGTLNALRMSQKRNYAM